MVDVVLPFMIESSRLRGRIVRLDSILDQIQQAHKYAAPVAQLTAEIATMAVLLGSMLKYDGIFTLQVQGDGPVKILVSDFTSAGDVRACATISKDAVVEAPLLGKGYMAFTVDQGEHTERYQGIVELRNNSLLESMQAYFTQSEQIRTGIKMAIAQVDGHWRGTAIMIQDMPEEGGIAAVGESMNVPEEEDNWRRLMLLLRTSTDEEMLSSLLSPEELLFRLFHEEGVRVFEAKTLQKGCRCSMEKVERVLSTMNVEDIAHITENDKITMTCEFCSRDFDFDPAALGRNMDA